MKKTLLTLIMACGLALFWAAGTASADDAAATTEVKPGEKVSVTFSYTPSRREKATLEEVYLAGEMNGWDAWGNELVKGEDGVFRVTLELAPGTYQWKFLLNGNWIQNMETVADKISPKPDTYVNDPYGGKNCENTFK